MFYLNGQQGERFESDRVVLYYVECGGELVGSVPEQMKGTWS